MDENEVERYGVGGAAVWLSHEHTRGDALPLQLLRQRIIIRVEFAQCRAF